MATGLSIFLPQGICCGLRRWYIIRLSKNIFFDEKVFLALRQKDFLDYTDTVAPQFHQIIKPTKPSDLQYEAQNFI